MSVDRASRRGALARVAGALSLNGLSSRSRDLGNGATGTRQTGSRPIGTESGPTGDDDLLDRERQLRVLMSNWM